MIAREGDDTAAAVWAAEALPEFTQKEPRCTCVHREVPIEALDCCAHDVAIHRFGVGEYECGDWPDCSLDRVEDIDRRIREAEIGLDRDGLGAERLESVAEPRDISRIAPPRHALVVGTPECGRDIPAVSSQSQRDGSADSLAPAGAGDQRDARRSVFAANSTAPPYCYATWLIEVYAIDVVLSQITLIVPSFSLGRRRVHVHCRLLRRHAEVVFAEDVVVVIGG